MCNKSSDFLLKALNSFTSVNLINVSVCSGGCSTVLRERKAGNGFKASVTAKTVSVRLFWFILVVSLWTCCLSTCWCFLFKAAQSRFDQCFKEGKGFRNDRTHYHKQTFYNVSIPLISSSFFVALKIYNMHILKMFGCRTGLYCILKSQRVVLQRDNGSKWLFVTHSLSVRNVLPWYLKQL